MAKMDRSEAQALGMKVYESYRNCTHGHIPTFRYSSGGNCVACHKQRYQQSATTVLKATVPRNQVHTFHEMCKAMGWTSHDAPSTAPDARTHDHLGLDTGWRPTPKGPVFLKPGE